MGEVNLVGLDLTDVIVGTYLDKNTITIFDY